jgi:uncharacterized protein
MMLAGALPFVRKLSLGAAFLLALLFGAERALAQEITFPSLTGRVVDEAGLLDAAKRMEIEAKLAALEEKTTNQLVVVTVRSLGGRTIEEYGYRLGRAWAIGQKDKNNGALLIVAPNERKVRIEVGYGLEGVLPDAITSLIIQNVILPRFKANDYPGGIANGVDEIIKVVSGEGGEWKPPVRPVEPKKNHTTLFGLLWLVVPFLFSGPGLILLVILLHFLFVLLAKLAFWLHLAPKPRKGSSWWGSSGSGSSWSSGSSSGSDSGGFSGGGGSFGGGGSSGSW